MKMIGTVLLFLWLTALSFTFFSATSYACSCLPPGSPKEELAKVDAVFSGEVLSVKDKYNSTKQVKVKVIESWKGIASKNITIYTSIDSASCGVHFESGKEYLIYAHLEDGKYTTYLCSRTSELVNAQLDLQELGKGTFPADTADSQNNPSTHNMVIGSVSIVLILGGCFLYRWKSHK
jgi:hypothetical protein